MAYLCEADELFYGGEAGGGKTDLLLGLGVTAHRKSIIFRREGTQFTAMVHRSEEILGETRARYNSIQKIWREVPGGRIVEFGAVPHAKDKRKYQGRPHDLCGFDEIPQFSELVFKYVSAWNRSSDPTQRVRVVCTGNPPENEEGRWVIKYWGPWLDVDHPLYPYPEGELLWFAALDGKDTIVESGDPFEHTDDDGKAETIFPKSRTFIRAGLDDNPFYGDEYRKVLQNLPEPLRSQLLSGDFDAGIGRDPFQVIPREWVELAEQRWLNNEENDHGPINQTGVDVVRGGQDNFVAMNRRGVRLDRPLIIPGKSIPDGPTAAGYVVDHVFGSLDKIDGSVTVAVDVIGIGSSCYDYLWGLDVYAIPVNFGAGSDYVTDANLRMKNLRAEAHWNMRELLDPENGHNIELPPGGNLKADLCAAHWSLTPGGILIEKKEKIKERLGRSPDDGDACLLACMNISSGIHV